MVKKTTINKLLKWMFSPPKQTKRTKRIYEQNLLPGQAIFLEYGNNLIIPVYGEQYAQNYTQSSIKSLYKKYGEKIIEFSLAPQDDYQREKKWPEEPFLNVLIKGNFQVSKVNWLGYIHPFEPEEKDKVRTDRQIYTRKIIELGKKSPLIIKGKIIKEGSSYSIILFASHNEIDKYLEKLS